MYGENRKRDHYIEWLNDKIQRKNDKNRKIKILMKKGWKLYNENGKRYDHFKWLNESKQRRNEKRLTP